MNAPTDSVFDRPAAKLAAFACTVGLVAGGGALIGAAIGPEPSDSVSSDAGTDLSAARKDSALGVELPDGLAVSRAGYTLVLEQTAFEPGHNIDLAFDISGPDGDPLTEFDVAHDKELHLIVVSRDLTDYRHVHPERGGDGTWRIRLPALAAGSYRVFADFTPAGRGSLTLGADIAVAGDFAPGDLPAASDSVAVDGTTVSLDGTLVAGTASTVTLSVADEDGPVNDLDPYLGALGHLVAIRAGDLGYLHVHPAEEATEPGGPDIEFTVEVPTPGTYRLFLDFSHRGEVHTAAFTIDAESDRGSATNAAEGDHGDH